MCAEEYATELAEPPEIQTRVNDRACGPMIRGLFAQGVAAGESEVADIDLTSRFVQANGMEAVRQIHDDPESRPEEATVEAVRRLIVGEKRQKKSMKRGSGGHDDAGPVAYGHGTAPRARSPKRWRQRCRSKVSTRT